MVYTNSAPQAYVVMGWGSARELSPGGTAVSKPTPAHRGGKTCLRKLGKGPI